MKETLKTLGFIFGVLLGLTLFVAIMFPLAAVLMVKWGDFLARATGN